MARTTPRSAITLATLMMFALIATACGAVVTAREQVETADVPPSAPILAPIPRAVSEAAPEPSAVPAQDGVIAQEAADRAPATGHNYGATLDEWSQSDVSAPAADQDAFRPGYSEITWEDLIPAGASGDDIFLQFEERIDSVEPGSPEADQLYEELQAAYNPEAVSEELDGQKIRLAGFVAPLTYDEDIVTEFLLVPTFGACIHVPPPPPNQTVMVSVDKENGLTVDESWGAVWVEGTIVIESEESDLRATSSRITDATSGAYNGY